MPACSCYPHGYDAKGAPGRCSCEDDPIEKVGKRYIRRNTGEEMYHSSKDFLWHPVKPS